MMTDKQSEKHICPASGIKVRCELVKVNVGKKRSGLKKDKQGAGRTETKGLCKK